MADVGTFFCPTCEKPFEFPRGQRYPYQFFRCRPCTEKIPELAKQIKRLTVHVQGGVAELVISSNPAPEFCRSANSF